MRRFLRGLFSIVLRVFFRRIEVHGAEQVPSGPVIFTPNHPSGLVDPLCLLCLAPRPVSFLAKAPLFRMPLLGALVRALDSLPVYRQQDQADTAKNQETFDAARALLGRGGTICIFPEGTSHSEPSLKPLKTGAARIALAAGPVAIVPCGLYYTQKTTFRSAVLLSFGPPIAVAAAAPEPEAVRALTDRIDAGLREVTLSADRAEALALADRVERSFFPQEALADAKQMRQRLVAGYAQLRTNAPDQLAALEQRIGRYEAALAQAGLPPDHIRPEELSPTGVARFVLATLLLLPLATIGFVLHWPAYRAVGVLALRFAHGEDDLVATIKVLASLLLFPLTWAIAAIAVGLGLGWPAALVTLVAAPGCAYAALVAAERLDRLVGGGRAIALFLFRRRGFERLGAEREAIRTDIQAVGNRLQL